MFTFFRNIVWCFLWRRYIFSETLWFLNERFYSVLFRLGFLVSKNRTNCKNYRGVALLDLIYKILATLIRTSVKCQEEIIGELQWDFRKGGSKTNQKFVIKQIFNNTSTQNLGVNLLIIENKRASFMTSLEGISFPG